MSSAVALILALMPGFLLMQEAPVPAPEAAPSAPEDVAAPPHKVLMPDDFEERVLSYGGAVGFLWEDAEPFKDYYKSLPKRVRGLLRWVSSGDTPNGYASTLAESKGGNLLCAFAAGSGEKDADKAIWLARCARSDRGEWSRFERVAKISELPHWDPVLFRDPRHAIYLFFRVGADRSSWQTYWMQSEDGGRTWSDAVELVPGDRGGRGPVKNKPIILDDGAWLAPASTERGDREQGAWKAFVDRSEDVGKTWQRSEDFVADPATIPGAGVLQPTLWQSSPNEVHALVRTSGGFIGRSDSHDGGRTWSPVVPSTVTNNNSPIDALRIEDGRILLVYNPARKDGGPRTPLALAVSTDNGATWTDLAYFEASPGDFSFPSIIRTHNGFAVSYTCDNKRIRCWQVPLKALDAP